MTLAHRQDPVTDDEHDRLRQRIAELERQLALAHAFPNMQSILDQLPIALFWKDQRAMFLGCNRSFVERVGLSSPAEIIGKADHAIAWGFQEAAHMQAADRRVIEQGVASQQVLEPVTHADGTRRWMRVNRLPLLDNNGHVIGMLGTLEDVTEQKQANDQVEQMHTFLTSIVDHIPHMIFVKEATDLRFVLWNTAGEELVGYSSEELLGKNDYDLFSPAEAAGFTSADRAVLSRDGVLDIPEELLQTRY